MATSSSAVASSWDVGKGAFMATSLKVPVFRNAFYPSAFPIISIGAGYAF